MIRAVVEPHGHGEEEPYTVDCDVETLHVLEGRFVLVLSTQSYELEAGDTVTFPGREPHTWRNPSDQRAVVLWTLVPAASGQ